ncbi:hypothetical protein SLEP1_g36990 [Rubroshorea leprosula]|uniref:Uncharacterized protein n=1 Tax=Rubroshorea leprosula TaxID=152421 RepID=A0AAV5KTC1_9ROSI|nr:hypothetical protein SLEP1_g36990 [Rubroshorea leprosula]
MVDKAQKALEEAETLKKHFARQEPVLNSSKYTAADVRIMNRKKEAEIMRENQVGTETEEIAVTEAGIMIVGAEIVTGIVIEIVIRIMSALELMILEVTTGHVQGLGNTLGIMIATGTVASNLFEDVSYNPL